MSIDTPVYKANSDQPINWGSVTPEAYMRDTNTAICVYNCDLRERSKIERTLEFAVARAVWYKQHLPATAKQLLKFDARGQDLTIDKINTIRDLFLEKVSRIDSRLNVETEFFI